MQLLIAALNDAVDDDKCTKCATDKVAATMTAYVQELKAAKKNGEWSKEEKKALKGEMKTLFKSVKSDVKAMRKAKA
jgi:GTP1/Obg family GTP-binding protein